MKKGLEVDVAGRLSCRTYEDGEEHTRYITEVVTNEVLLLDRKPDGV